jgi:hypothetical protein
MAEVRWHGIPLLGSKSSILTFPRHRRRSDFRSIPFALSIDIDAMALAAPSGGRSVCLTQLSGVVPVRYVRRLINYFLPPYAPQLHGDRH